MQNIASGATCILAGRTASETFLWQPKHDRGRLMSSNRWQTKREELDTAHALAIGRALTYFAYAIYTIGVISVAGTFLADVEVFIKFSYALSMIFGAGLIGTLIMAAGHGLMISARREIRESDAPTKSGGNASDPVEFPWSR